VNAIMAEAHILMLWHQGYFFTYCNSGTAFLCRQLACGITNLSTLQ